MLLIQYLLVLVNRHDLHYLLINSKFSDGCSVKFENGSFSWSNIVNDSFILKKSVTNEYFFERAH